MGYDPRNDPAVNGRRTEPDCPGQNAKQLNGRMSPDHWRTSDLRPAQAHRGSSHNRRFGVKPTGGAVADIWVGHGEQSAVRRTLALEEAAKLARTPREDEMVAFAERVAKSTGPDREQGILLLQATVLPDLAAYGQERHTQIADLIRERLSL